MFINKKKLIQVHELCCPRFVQIHFEQYSLELFSLVATAAAYAQIKCHCYKDT